MFTAPSKVYFTVAGLAVLSGALFVLATGDRGGFTLLVIAGVVAAALAVGVFAFVPPDPVAAALVEGDGTDPDAADDSSSRLPAGADDPPRPSLWPLGGAAALTLAAVGAAVSKPVLVLGIIVTVIVAFSWLGQVWREHPSWTRDMTDRLNERFIIPIGLPGTVLALVGIGVVSFSRLLLAVNKEAATAVALAAAVLILGGCAFVASRPRMGRAALGALATFSGAMVLAAGVAGAVKGERDFEEHEAGDVIELVAKDLAFEPEELDLPAGKVKVEFKNEDPGVQHNLAILSDTGGDPLFRGKLVDGGKTEEYAFESPPAGKYTFVCEVHPKQMTGSVLVAPDSSEKPKPGGGPSPAPGK